MTRRQGLNFESTPLCPSQSLHGRAYAKCCKRGNVRMWNVKCSDEDCWHRLKHKFAKETCKNKKNWFQMWFIMSVTQFGPLLQMLVPHLRRKSSNYPTDQQYFDICWLWEPLLLMLSLWETDVTSILHCYWLMHPFAAWMFRKIDWKVKVSLFCILIFALSWPRSFRLKNINEKKKRSWYVAGWRKWHDSNSKSR